MRIALIASLLPADTIGGAERYAAAAARSLAERHDVVVLTGSELGTVDGVEVERLPHLPRLASDASPFDKVVWHARDQWLPSVHMALKRELRRIAPDVVATHHPQGLSAAVFTAVGASGIPHVHTAHDLNVLCARTSMTRNGQYCGGRCLSCRIQRGVRGGTLRRDISALIGVSDYICRRHVDAHVVPPERAVTIRLGARGATSRLRRPVAEPTLGFIGALAPHKGVQTLLAALQQTSRPWKLRIAGDGPLASSVEEAARRNHRITYVGRVEGDVKDEFFDSIDLVVIPSEWEEPATLVAAEACVRGIPAVVSNRGGLPETPHARAFRSGDPAALVDAIEWFLSDDRLADASARLVATHGTFTWGTHMHYVECVLETVRANPRPGPGVLVGST
jgi:glycosyltransferase involved in cell wall biosynthesis